MCPPATGCSAGGRGERERESTQQLAVFAMRNGQAEIAYLSEAAAAPQHRSPAAPPLFSEGRWPPAGSRRAHRPVGGPGGRARSPGAGRTRAGGRAGRARTGGLQGPFSLSVFPDLPREVVDYGRQLVAKEIRSSDLAWGNTPAKAEPGRGIQELEGLLSQREQDLTQTPSENGVGFRDSEVSVIARNLRQRDFTCQTTYRKELEIAILRQGGATGQPKGKPTAEEEVLCC